MHCRALTFVFAAAVAVAVSAPLAAEDACTTYGTGVGLDRATAVAEILAAPEAWAGERVRVEGEVREVCPMAGCWLSIVAGDGEEHLRIKVTDGEIVFPLSARGRHAAAEGVVEVHDMTRARYAAWLAHLAEERGESFDPASVGPGPYRRVQVAAEGATVCAEPPAAGSS